LLDLYRMEEGDTIAAAVRHVITEMYGLLSVPTA
jgi:hypothetical protein